MTNPQNSTTTVERANIYGTIRVGSVGGGGLFNVIKVTDELILGDSVGWDIVDLGGLNEGDKVMIIDFAGASRSGEIGNNPFSYVSGGKLFIYDIVIENRWGDIVRSDENGDYIYALIRSGEDRRIVPPLSLSPVFIGNAIRQAAISDNSSIYSNMGQKVWAAAQINGATLSDNGEDFKASNTGAKAGFAFVNGESFSLGLFAGFASRGYEQGGNKADASDIDFGFYSGFGIGQRINVGAFVGGAYQSINTKDAALDASFNAIVIKYGAKVEYSLGLISPFVAFESSIVNISDIDLGALTLEGGAWTRMTSQIGAKLERKVGKFALYVKPYLDLLLAGAKPQYSVKNKPANLEEGGEVENVSIDFNASKESGSAFGLGFGASLPVSGFFNVFANADIKMAGDYFGYQSNVGASFKF